MFETEYTGEFQVEATQACVAMKGLPPSCGVESLPHPGFLAAEKQSDDMKVIIKFGN